MQFYLYLIEGCLIFLKTILKNQLFTFSLNEKKTLNIAAKQKTDNQAKDKQINVDEIKENKTV